jgi:RimJ/RimL family protein N-acetyltransferase
MTASHLTVRRGEVRPGESWYAAAVRKSGDPSCKPWASDLSGELLVFGVGQGPGDVASIDLRRMTREDFPVFVAWRSMPHVARWWNAEVRTVRDIEQLYGKVVDGLEPDRLWVVEINDRAVGFLQCYRIGNHPEYALLTAEPDSIGVDYLIGEPDLVGRGVGTRVVWEFLRTVVSEVFPQAKQYFAAPDHRNGASRRMLLKLGFTEGLWFDEPHKDGSTHTVVGYTFDVPTILG